MVQYSFTSTETIRLVTTEKDRDDDDELILNVLMSVDILGTS